MNGDQSLLRTALLRGHVYYLDQTMSCYRLNVSGGFNSRLKSLPESDQRKFWLNKAKGELLYDEYSFRRFHEWVIHSVSNIVISAGAFDQVLMDEFLSDMNLQKKDVLSFCKMNIKLIYYLSVYMHPLYLFLKRVYNSRRK